MPQRGQRLSRIATEPLPNRAPSGTPSRRQATIAAHGVSTGARLMLVVSMSHHDLVNVHTVEYERTLLRSINITLSRAGAGVLAGRK